VRRLVAWRILAHEKGRSVLAVGGIFVAVLLIFLELGFYFSVPKGGMLIYDKLRFDIMLASSAYFFQGQSFEFPRRRLFQASALPEVTAAVPLYQGSAPWFNKASTLRRDVFVIGFNLRDRVFDAADIDRHIDALKRPDTVLVDEPTRPMFGAIAPGGHVEIGEAVVRIPGPVPRCVVTTQHPETGIRDLDTLRIVKAYRGVRDGRKVDFGVYADVEEPGRVRVGDSVLPV